MDLAKTGAMTVTEQIVRIDKRVAKLVKDRESLVRRKAYESGWRPCDDCFDGYCSMNCSSAPTYIQVLI